MSTWKSFKAKSCTVELGASTKEAVLAEIVDLLVASKTLPETLREGAVAALLDRERTGSTGVGTNVAIPHVKLKGLETVVCSLAVHERGVSWAAIDGAPVHIVFTVLRPDRPTDKHDPTKHLEMMQWIARLSRDADFRRFALQVETKAELIELLEEKSGV
ncbi:MAG: PTS sugar transporter subunit IIA [Planctomycetota bacterium]|nr:PTS sugar transporter subunit IIA [Planctomycetota bacterium]